MAQPTKCTPQVQKAICDAIRLGNHIDVAARFGGITRETLYQWLKKGRASARQPYRGFAEECDRALAECETRLLGKVQSAGQTDWKASAWILERRFRERWGASATVTLKQIAKELEDASDDELLAIAGIGAAEADGAGAVGEEGSED